MDGLKKSFFTRMLMRWHNKHNRREMPWKQEKDPYKIWLSEIILQQTRVDQGWEYYNRFVKKYPTIHQLAAAPEKDVFKLWEGLGYYSRCRNLIATAKYVVENLNAVFPATYESIVQLKGVGPYTAAAIASFAYNLPYAVNDGNVMRVLSRFFGIDADVSSSTGKKIFSELSQSLLPKGKSALFNQAIMDFGATVCKPAQPLCDSCILSARCIARQHHTQSFFPVKSKKTVRKKRYFYYLILEYRKRFYVRLRQGKDIWQNLHEFVLVEKDEPITAEELIKPATYELLAGSGFSIISISEPYRQLLTHQEINGCFIHLRLKQQPQLAGLQPVSREEMTTMAFPQFINQYLHDKPF